MNRRLACIVAVGVSMACLTSWTATAAAAPIIVMIGDDDGFEGTQGANADPGDVYTVDLLPKLPAPAVTLFNEAGMDAETDAPFAPYTFVFEFLLDTTSLSSVASAELFIQTGSLGLLSGVSGFGHADVFVDGTNIGDFYDVSSSRGSPLEESVKGHTFDVTAYVSPGSITTLTVRLDGTDSLATEDLFAIDFARVTVDGVSAVPEPSSISLVCVGLAGIVGFRATRRGRKVRILNP